MDIKKSDTWPPLQGRAEDQDGALPLDEAEEILIFFRHKTSLATPLITGTILGGTIVDVHDPDGDGFNWDFNWWNADGNVTDVIGDYDVELQITWGSVPLRVESVPNRKTNNPTVTVWEDID